MGTKAVFTVSVGDKISNAILGMTNDGFPENLKMIANNFLYESKDLGLEERVKQFDKEAIDAVYDALIVSTDGWVFKDEYNNAEWVRYTCVLSLTDGKINIYEGQPSLKLT